VPPTGTVACYDTAQNVLLGVVPLKPLGNGPDYTESVGTFTTSALGTGFHQVVAIYNGDTVYPVATAGSAVEFVGSPAQVQLFSFISLFQNNLATQISEPQLDRWTTRLQNGAPPQHVARSIIRFVYFNTKFPRQQKAALLERARQLKLIPAR